MARWLQVHVLALAILASALPWGAAGDPLIVAVAPRLPDGTDGAIAIWSATETPLDGYTMDFGARTAALPPGVVAGPVPVWLARNATAWLRFGGPVAHAWPALDWGVRSGEAQLVGPSGPVDAVAWGEATVEGMAPIRHVPDDVVYRRRHEANFVDTDTPQDWATPRIHRVGESTLAPRSFEVERLTLYASPDSSHGVLAGLIRGARERLHLHVYEFTSPSLGDEVVHALEANPGLDVQVLVTAVPVGLEADDRSRQADILDRIQQAGGEAVLATPGRYAHHHLKVLVADDAVAVQSENWVPPGVPQDPSWGNRGWGVVLHDRGAADWFAQWMAEDRAAWDAQPFDLAAFDPMHQPPVRLPPRTGPYGPRTEPLVLTGPFTVRPLVAPDMTTPDPVSALVRNATESVLLQQLQLGTRAANRLGWNATDPLAQALREATSKADVRVMVAQAFGDDDPNGRALDALRPHGVEGKAGDRPGIATWHNKGAIVDGRWVIVGSMNAGHASRTANREVSVLLDAPEVAAYYAALFQADWDGETERQWGVPGADLRGLALAPLPTLLAAIGVATVLVRRA